MEVIIGNNAGFCYGVQKAVETTKKMLQECNKIQCLGELVHNSRVIKELEESGLKTISDISKATKKTIIRAHGVSKKVYEEAEKRKIELLDLTCPNVLKIHKIIEEYVNNDYFVFLIGSKKHPETLGSFGFANNNGYIIETDEDINLGIENLKKSNRNKLLIIVQTTFSLIKFNNLVDNITNILDKSMQEKLGKNENITIEIKNTICNATKIRQEETKELSSKVDCMIIIGGKNSSNTKKLYEIAKLNCENTFLIESLEELEYENMNKFEKIGIMAGASTPKDHIEQVKKFLIK